MPNEDEKKPQVDPARSLASTYPSNSKKSKEGEPDAVIPEKKIEKLEGIQAVKQKPPLGRRIRAAFTGDDARSVGDYLLFEVAVPAIKSTIFDLITSGANRAMFGGGGQAVNNSNIRRPAGQINYSQVSRAQVNGTVRPQMTERDKATHNFDNVTFPNRQQAEQALIALMSIINTYGVVAVSDFYELVDVTGSFADDRWGWFNLDGADIAPVRGGGFVLQLPPTQSIR